MADAKTYREALSRWHVVQLFLSTLPVFFVLCYFLYVAHQRPYDPYYTDDVVIDDDAVRAQIEEPHFSLIEMLWVFLSVLFLWTLMALYLSIFVPRRRKLMALYLSNGETVKGDVRFDNEAGLCSCKPTWCLWNCSGCCGFCARDFSDLVYTVDTPGGHRATVTKVVRTYKPWYRERVSILVLPGLPHSGLPQSDVETDVKSQGKNRITDLYYVIAFWVVFLLGGALYVVFQVGAVHDEMEYARRAWIIYGVCVGLDVPVAYAVNAARFWHYKRWLTNSGTVEIGTTASSGGGGGSNMMQSAAADPEDPDGYRGMT